MRSLGALVNSQLPFVLGPGERYALKRLTARSVDWLEAKVVLVSKVRPHHDVTFSVYAGRICPATEATAFDAHENGATVIREVRCRFQEKARYGEVLNLIGAPADGRDVIRVHIGAAEKKVPQRTVIHKDVHVGAITAPGLFQYEGTRFCHARACGPLLGRPTP